MKHSDAITSIQFAVIIMSTMIGVSLLVLPKVVADKAGEASALAGIVGIFIASISLFAITLLGKRFPKQTVIEYNKIILGKYLGNFFSFIIILFFVILMGLETRHFAEVLIGGLLPNTPIQVSIFFMIFLCATIGYNNVSSFANIHFFYLPFILIPIVMLILGFKDIEFYHLLPILGHDVSFQDFIGGSLIVSQAITNFFLISMIIPYMKEPEKCVKSGFWGFLLGGFSVLSILVMALAVFGSIEIRQMFWPVLVLGRMIQVPGELLARIDSIVIIAWIFAVFTTLLSYYFVFVRGMVELFKLKKYRIISVLGFPVVFFVALIPEDIYELYDFILSFTLAGLLLVIVYPVILLMVAKIRKKKGSA